MFIAKKSKDVEKNRILESREQELKEYLKRQNRMTDQIAELSIEKEQLLGEISALTRHSDSEDDEKKSLKKEIEVLLLLLLCMYVLSIIILLYNIIEVILKVFKFYFYEFDYQVYQNGISAQRLRFKDCEKIQKMKLDDNLNEMKMVITQLKDKHSALLDSLNGFREKIEKEMNSIRASHETELDLLDKTVKNEVGKKEEELQILKDAVETEKVI